MVGGAGNDSISVDYTNTGGGNNLIFGNMGDDFIDIGYLGAGSNTIYGGQGNDTIYSGASADVIDGGIGDDSIIGNYYAGNGIFGGADTLTGGDGADTFSFERNVYGTGNDGYASGNASLGDAGVVHISDLVFGMDKIDISATTLNEVGNAGTLTAPTTLEDAASAAMNVVAAQNPGASQSDNIGAVFNYSGQDYLTVNEDGNAGFTNGADLLVNVTGFTGTIAKADFV